MKELAKRMVEIDSNLSEESANWNHNLAHTFRTIDKIKRRAPEKLDDMLSKFNVVDWAERGVEPLKEIESLDPELAKDIAIALYRVKEKEDTLKLAIRFENLAKA